jgi:transcriptional regulator with XRE-family HTH domain
MRSGTDESHTLRWWRLNEGLTLDALAIRARVSKQTVIRVEKGRPGLEAVVRAVTVALGIPTDALRNGPPEEPHTTLTALREHASVSVRELSFRTGVASAVIRRAEAGAAIQPDQAKRLSDALGSRVTDWYPTARELACSHSS